jgi:hypothetical protein
MIMKTSTSPIGAIRELLALRSETYAVEHKFEYWVWALAVCGAALSCQILDQLTALASRSTPDHSDLAARHPYS